MNEQSLNLLLPQCREPIVSGTPYSPSVPASLSSQETVCRPFSSTLLYVLCIRTQLVILIATPEPFRRWTRLSRAKGPGGMFTLGRGGTRMQTISPAGKWAWSFKTMILPLSIAAVQHHTCIVHPASSPQCPSYVTCWDEKICLKCGESTSTTRITESLHARPSKTLVIGVRAGARRGDEMQTRTLQTQSKPSQAKRAARNLQDPAVRSQGGLPSFPCARLVQIL